MQKPGGSNMSAAFDDLRVSGIAAVAQSIKTRDALSNVHTSDESAIVKAFDFINKTRETLEKRYPGLFMAS